MNTGCHYGVTMNSHGYLEFTWRNSVLYVEAFGPFNEEGAIEASKEYLNQIANTENSDYSIIEIWDEDSFGSPKAMETVAGMWNILSGNNCTSIAIVISNSVQRSLYEKLLPSNGHIFTKKEDADILIQDNLGV